jgi:hypothetical protein
MSSIASGCARRRAQDGRGPPTGSPQPTLLIEQILQLIHDFERDHHRTKNRSKTKGRMMQTIGRAHAIKGFVADRPKAVSGGSGCSG